jgi:exodeoxyribonuclease X
MLNLGSGLPPGLRSHRAAYDVLVTARLFVHLASQTEAGSLSLEVLRGGSGGDEATLF